MFTVHKPYSHRVIFLALLMNIQIVCELCITDVFINPSRLWATRQEIPNRKLKTLPRASGQHSSDQCCFHLCP